MTSFTGTFATPTPTVLVRLCNKTPEDNEIKHTKNDWWTAIPIDHIGTESAQEALVELIEERHSGARRKNETGEWMVLKTQVVWDMPAGHEITTRLSEGDSAEMLDALIWRKARDFLVVEYKWCEPDENGEILLEY